MPPESVRCEDFRIARRQGCARSLNWRFSWRGDARDGAALSRALEREGMTSVVTVPGLAHLHGEEGQVLIVLRSLRVELRLPYTVCFKDRPRAALALARRVARALRALAPPPADHPSEPSS